MCRWFAYVSPGEECLLEDVLITPAHSLSKQVHDHYLPKLISHDPENVTSEHEISVRNRLFNVDGLGVAWYTTVASGFGDGSGQLKPALYKNSQPPTNDANFHSICANTATTACFAHIRAATATSTTPVNNHPFVFGRHAIMHNGVVFGFIKIKRDLEDLIDDDIFEHIQGSTDSEHVAALYMTMLTKTSTEKGANTWNSHYSAAAMSKALTETFIAILKLQHQILGESGEANSLNVAVTDGKQLVAFRFRNHDTEQPPSPYYSQSAGVTLNRKYPDHPTEGIKNPRAFKKPEEHGRHIIVASEPSTYKKKRMEINSKEPRCCCRHRGKCRGTGHRFPEGTQRKGQHVNTWITHGRFARYLSKGGETVVS